jgi:predicted transcriptional regulator
VNRTIIIRVGPVEQARREFKEDLAVVTKGSRLRHRREIWFASLGDAAKTLTEQRLALLRLLSEEQPRSITDLARMAHRGSKRVAADLHVLARVGLVQLVGAGDAQRPVAACDRIQLAGDLALPRAAA